MTGLGGNPSISGAACGTSPLWSAVTVNVAAAIANAIYNATSMRVIDTPLLWRQRFRTTWS
jgi:hypothetical protein